MTVNELIQALQRYDGDRKIQVQVSWNSDSAWSGDEDGGSGDVKVGDHDGVVVIRGWSDEDLGDLC